MSTQKLKPAPVFEPFRWVSPDAVAPMLPAGRVLRLSSLAHDVASGAAVVLGVLERIETDAAFEDDEGQPIAPLFSQADAGYLRRLAIVSLELLRDEAERFNLAVTEEHPSPTPPTSQG